MNYGRYEVTRELGKGSMGVVYEARDPQIGRVVAVKVLRPDRAGNEAIVKRFLREAKAIGRLSHPRIVTIYDAGEDQGNVYIAMELVEGQPLDEVLDERRLTAQEAVDVGAQVAETLHYAHQKGVVHRDVKPSNILLQPNGQIKITDFGIARIQDSTETVQTQAGTMMGTPAYMSPEQVMGRPVDGRSDIFSLGVVLYELCAAKRPFGGEHATLASILTEIVHSEPPPLPSKGPGAVPAGLAAVILKCLRKAPDERYAAGNDVAAALAAALAPPSRPKARPEKESAPEGAAPLGSRRTALVAAGVAALTLAAVVGVYRHRAGQPPAVQATARPQPPPVAAPSAPAPAPSAPAPEPSPAPAPEARPAPPPAEERAPARPAPREPRAADRKEPEGKPRPTAPATTPAREKPAAAATTPVKILSTPDGASVSVDGRAVGRTPATFMVPLGKHRIRATHAGYRDAETEVEVRETMEFPIRLLLEPAD